MARRNNVSMRKRRNNVSMRKRRNNVSMRKRRNNVSMRKRRNNLSMRRNNMMRRMYGGYDSTPAPTMGNSMATMEAQSLAQGRQFDAMHAKQHGGATITSMPMAANPSAILAAATPKPMVATPMAAAPMAQRLAFSGNVALSPQKGGGVGLDAGPFPGAVTMPSVLPDNLHASARVAPLDAAIKEIQNLKDQSGGRRRRRRGSKKSRKTAKKSRKGRKGMKGGAWSMENAQSVSASGMLLPSGLESKALSGMNAEWKLAENPKAFAPGYASY